MGDDARIEARGLKSEARASRFYNEPPCLSADRDTSFDNEKRHFQFNETVIEPNMVQGGPSCLR